MHGEVCSETKEVQDLNDKRRLTFIIYVNMIQSNARDRKRCKWLLVRWP